MTTIKLTTFGDSVGAVFPQDVLAKLSAREGDQLFVVETEKGIELTPMNPELVEQVETARQVMREDHQALRKLAE